MSHAENRIHAAGTCLAVASFLMISVFAFHGPIAPELADQMTRIAGGAVRWFVVHWMAAAALSLFAVSGLLVLTSQSRLAGGPWTAAAWAIFAVGALWTVTTAVAEATVIADAAAAGLTERFEAWWAFAEGMGSGFAALALAAVIVAGNEARSLARATPPWAAWTAAAAGAASFMGWALGMWFGIGIGNFVWLVSSILMTAWLFWFGLGLTRFRESVPAPERQRPAEKRTPA